MAGLVLSGCGQVEIKNNTVIKNGTLQTKSGEEYLLNTDEGIINITSQKIDLDSYMKKEITVEGMYSGDILYVDKIEKEN